VPEHCSPVKAVCKSKLQARLYHQQVGGNQVHTGCSEKFIIAITELQHTANTNVIHNYIDIPVDIHDIYPTGLRQFNSIKLY
jgi:hypothetical protein